MCLLSPAISAYSAVRYVPDIRLRSTVTRLISAGRGSPRPEQPLGRGSALPRLGAELVLSSVVPFSSCPQSLPASESFTMSQLFP